MKKGSVTSKLLSSFFVHSKFKDTYKASHPGQLILLLLFNAPGTLFHNGFYMHVNVNKS